MIGKTTVALAIASLVCVTAGPGFAHLGFIPTMAGLALFALSGVLGLAAIVTALIAALRDKAWFHALIGMLGFLPLIAVLAVTADGFRYPVINDITTDTVDPPAFVHALTLPELAGRDLAFPPANGAIIKGFYTDLNSLHVDEPALQVHQRAKAIALSKPFSWTITQEMDNYGGFEAIATTQLFRWNDDVIVRIRPEGDKACVVDVRSRSREGKGDLGANARRIRRFLEALQE